MLAPLVAALALIPAPVALAPTEPPPTDVRLAWTADDHESFALTWSETGDVRNKVKLVSADGSGPEYGDQFVEAGQPNRLVIPSGLDPGDFVYRVTVVDAEGNNLSEPGESPEFDADRTPLPVITAVVPQPDGSITMTWTPGKYTDSNPGDPLDVPSEAVPRYQPIVSHPTWNDYQLFGPVVRGAGSLVVRDRAAPLFVGLETVRNEWFGTRATIAKINGTRLTASIPSTAVTGGRLTVTGKSEQLPRVCDLAACETFDGPDPARELQLQARADAAGPWRTVATTKTRADGSYKFTGDFEGKRDYRVVAAAVAWVPEDEALVYAATAPKTVRAGGSEDGGQGGGLPITGTPVTWIAVAGGLLVLAGAALALTGRLRRRFVS